MNVEVKMDDGTRVVADVPSSEARRLVEHMRVSKGDGFVVLGTTTIQVLNLRHIVSIKVGV